jgi:N-acetylmuramoyl-L-alanine amidase
VSRTIGVSESWVNALINTLTNYQRYILVIITSLFLTGGAIEATAKPPLFEAYKRTIVIDPGHGGNDIGARGPEGATEKAVTLNLARILATELEREYRVVLTRNDDYQVDLGRRTAAANHHNADLFISIHTGGSFVHSTSGLLIFHYYDFTEKPRAGGGSTSLRQQDNDSPISWDSVQSRYLEKSQILARMINTRLGGLSVIAESRVRGAPLAVLQGADMPAILIEIGFLTNPAEEKNFQDQRFLSDLAISIRRGINEYFLQKK